ncbi:hypothetical protein GCM10020256_60970 [Streptomyces thermocoprophilus]
MREAELRDVEEQISEIQALWEAKKIRASSYVVALDDLNERKNELLADRAVHDVPAGGQGHHRGTLGHGMGGSLH